MTLSSLVGCRRLHSRSHTTAVGFSSAQFHVRNGSFPPRCGRNPRAGRRDCRTYEVLASRPNQVVGGGEIVGGWPRFYPGGWKEESSRGKIGSSERIHHFFNGTAQLASARGRRAVCNKHPSPNHGSSWFAAKCACRRISWKRERSPAIDQATPRLTPNAGAV